jgi:hypothetical protein
MTTSFNIISSPSFIYRLSFDIFTEFSGEGKGFEEKRQGARFQSCSPLALAG